ncbi:lipid phosphate phosphatase 1 [Flagelloscypha sp. PMI_526]|nr:lipid phosphate phosphatase 1 [Flagelloscypha sp. PMI_526]
MEWPQWIPQGFRPDDLEYLPIAYVLDWVTLAVVWLLSWVADTLPIFERDFTLDDPLISHPHKPDTVSSPLNQLLAMGIPIFCMAFIGLLRKSPVEIHHAIVSVLASSGFTRMITRALKHKVGRLRPDFLARCQWSDELKACTGHAADIASGRKSFPSGHSSTAFSGFFLLSLWIAGQTGAWCLSRPLPAYSWTSTKLGRILLTLIPIAWAGYVALSRMSDYRHHKEDIIAGSLVGIITSTVSYLIYWPSPLSRASYKGSTYRPNVLYNEEYAMSPGARQFALDSQEDLHMPGAV